MAERLEGGCASQRSMAWQLSQARRAKTATGTRRVQRRAWRGSSSAGQGGKDASGGEEEADEEFFGEEWGVLAGGVDAGEVDERGGGENGVAFEHEGRHEAEDDAGGCGCRGDGHGQKDAAMTPVEEMAVAEAVDLRRAEGGARVEEPVCDVDGPDGESEQRRNPEGKMDAGSPGEGERPDQSDGGRV